MKRRVLDFLLIFVLLLSVGLTVNVAVAQDGEPIPDLTGLTLGEVVLAIGASSLIIGLLIAFVLLVRGAIKSFPPEAIELFQKAVDSADRAHEVMVDMARRSTPKWDDLIADLTTPVVDEVLKRLQNMGQVVVSEQGTPPADRRFQDDGIPPGF